MIKEALFVKNAYLKGDGFSKIEDDLQYYANKLNFSFLVKSNKDFIGSSLKFLPKAGVFWDKDIALALLLESRGIKLSNSAKAIALCDDKALSYSYLYEKLPMPKSVILPMSYPNVGYDNFDFIEQVEDYLKYPFVIKEGKGSFGWQVYLSNSREESLDILSKIGTKSVLFQEFIKESSGRDLRVYVVNGKVVASMLRENTSGDFRANIEIGGSAKAYNLTKEQEEIALLAVKEMKLDFAGVDLLFSKSGPLLCEVNSNAHYKALERVSHESPAKYIAQMIGDRL